MRMPTRLNRRSGDSGVALILVLLAILVLTTLAAAMVFSARSETLASYNYRIGTQAEYVALAGVQKALNFFNSSSYVPLPPDQAATGTYYQTSIYANTPVTLYFTNATPVNCTSNCISHAGAVTLGTGAGSSAYPPPSVTLDAGGTQVNVVSNWVAAMNNQGIADSTGGTGNYTVTATLLEYHTVNNAFFGTPAAGCADPSAGFGICRQPFEVWRVTSTGTWNSNIGGGSASPTVTVVATISPMFLPYFGHGLYGLCSVTMSGTNVCTDSYNSAYGQYGAGAAGCVDPSSGTSNAQYANSGVGSNGGITLNGSVHVGGDITFANQNPDPSCNTGFSGSTTNVAGTVTPGPAIPDPPTIDMTLLGYPTTTPAILPAGGGGSGDKVANVYLRQTTPPPLPPGASGTACAGGSTAYLERYIHTYTKGANSYSSYSCVGISGSGTSSDPYRLGDITANSSNPGTINLIAPTATSPISNPVHVAMNSIDVGTNGAIRTSNQAPAYPPAADNTYTPMAPAPTPTTASAFVLDVAGNVNMGGTSSMNYNPATPGVPSPAYLTMNVMGTGSPALDLTGQSQLAGMITVPNGDVRLAGSGTGGTFFGSILANNITDNGNYPVHYDLSMKNMSGQLYKAQVVSVTRPKM
jgi:Tfp pilus assembly protein PilX